MTPTPSHPLPSEPDLAALVQRFLNDWDSTERPEWPMRVSDDIDLLRAALAAANHRPEPTPDKCGGTGYHGEGEFDLHYDPKCPRCTEQRDRLRPPVEMDQIYASVEDETEAVANPSEPARDQQHYTGERPCPFEQRYEEHMRVVHPLAALAVPGDESALRAALPATTETTEYADEFLYRAEKRNAREGDDLPWPPESVR